jgi:hypothetical protein
MFLTNCYINMYISIGQEDIGVHIKIKFFLDSESDIYENTLGVLRFHGWLLKSCILMPQKILITF